jgi:hypothetical protein
VTVYGSEYVDTLSEPGTVSIEEAAELAELDRLDDSDDDERGGWRTAR